MRGVHLRVLAPVINVRPVRLSRGTGIEIPRRLWETVILLILPPLSMPDPRALLQTIGTLYLG